jgi:hypothetical protein
MKKQFGDFTVIKDDCFVSFVLMQSEKHLFNVGLKTTEDGYQPESLCIGEYDGEGWLFWGGECKPIDEVDAKTKVLIEKVVSEVSDWIQMNFDEYCAEPVGEC